MTVSPYSSPDFTEKKVHGDLVKYELSDLYNYEPMQLTNPELTDVSVSDPVGYPVLADGTLAKAGDEGSVAGLVCGNPRQITVAGSGVTQADYKVIARGPAVVSKVALPTNDILGGAFNLTTLAATLAGLNIIVRDGAALKATQTT